LKKLLFIFLLPITCVAQVSSKKQTQVDSLKQVIKNAKHDSTLINAWVAWDNIIYAIDPILDLHLNKKIDSLSSLKLQEKSPQQLKIKFQKSRAFALNNIGINYQNQGDYIKAIDYYIQAQEIYREIDDKKGTAKCFNNIGLIYKSQGDYAKAVDFFTQSLKMHEEIGAKQGMGVALNNIGTIYKAQEDYTKAIDFFTQSRKIYEEINDQRRVATSLNNIGTIYLNQGDYTKAIDHFTQSLKTYKAFEDKKGIALALNNIGVIYNKQKDYTKAIDYYTQCLEIYKALGDKSGIANTLNNIGTIYQDQGNPLKALEYYKNALNIAQKIGDTHKIAVATQSLWVVNKSLGYFKEGLKMYELYIKTRDSIRSKKNQKEIIRQEYKYKYEKQAAADSIKAVEAAKVIDAQLLAEQAQNKQSQQQKYFLFAGLLLALLFGGFIFNRFRLTDKQKKIIEQQKSEVEQQKATVEAAHKKTERQKYLIEQAHTQITDSINYAKRLQNAILPSLDEVNTHLPNNFILFKPKDVVSGDFYWFEHLDGTSYLAAADCTGHGVPGAMISVVCSNALNRSVNEFGILSPAKILNKTRELVIETFAKSGERVQDGMDIVLCAFKDNKVIYSGANNPLWIVRKTELLTQAQKENPNTITEHDLSIIEYKANRQPVGLYPVMKDFTQEEIALYPGDSLYFSTDGFADQFGGEKGKKFKRKPFKQSLLALNELPMAEQTQRVSNTFENWKGPLEQIDDVCVIGVKIE